MFSSTVCFLLYFFLPFMDYKDSYNTRSTYYELEPPKFHILAAVPSTYFCLLFFLEFFLSIFNEYQNSKFFRFFPIYSFGLEIVQVLKSTSCFLI